MIRFLAKIVIPIVVLGVAAVELGSPLFVRAQLDGVAHDVANEAAFTLARTHEPVQAQATAQDVVAGRHATLRAFRVEGPATVNVSVAREAPSAVLKKWGRTKSWYDVEVSTSATRSAN